MHPTIEPVGGEPMLQLVPVSQAPPDVLVHMSPVQVCAAAGAAEATSPTTSVPPAEAISATAMTSRIQSADPAALFTSAFRLAFNIPPHLFCILRIVPRSEPPATPPLTASGRKVNA